MAPMGLDGPATMHPHGAPNNASVHIHVSLHARRAVRHPNSRSHVEESTLCYPRRPPRQPCDCQRRRVIHHPTPPTRPSSGCHGCTARPTKSGRTRHALSLPLPRSSRRPASNGPPGSPIDAKRSGHRDRTTWSNTGRLGSQMWPLRTPVTTRSRRERKGLENTHRAIPPSHTREILSQAEGLHSGAVAAALQCCRPELLVIASR